MNNIKLYYGTLTVDTWHFNTCPLSPWCYQASPCSLESSQLSLYHQCQCWHGSEWFVYTRVISLILYHYLMLTQFPENLNAWSDPFKIIKVQTLQIKDLANILDTLSIFELRQEPFAWDSCFICFNILLFCFSITHILLNSKVRIFRFSLLNW